VPFDREQIAAALSPYEVGEQLGRGATGVVLEARHRQLGRFVAVKVLSPELADHPSVRRRFAAEAKLLASFSHVHIVPIYDFVERDGLCLLIMERLTGGTLATSARAGLDPPAACAAVLSICSALQYAHDRDILHRDVKPDNALVADDGVLKMTDFGIAKVLGGVETSLTRTGFVLGTPAYMAPEQAEGSDPGPETDVYAVGTILYELLAGRLPFDRDANVMQMLYRRINVEPRPLLEVAPDVPPELAEVIMRALERDRADRYASAEEVGVAIAKAATAAWGPGWLERTAFALTAGPILSAAQGGGPAPEAEPGATVGSATATAGTPADGGGRPPAGEPPAHEPPSGDGGGDGPGRRDSADETSGRGGGRRRIALGAGVALAAIAAVAIALIAGGDDDPRGPAEAETTAQGPPARADSEWAQLLSAPTARQQAPATVLDGIAWVLGGLSDGPPGGKPVASRQVEGYDTVLNTWQSRPDLPVRLHHAMAVTYEGELVVLGGWIPKGGSLIGTTSNRVFALRGGEWEELPPMSEPRAAGAAAVVGDRIVVVGGQADGALVGGTEVFDGEQWSAGAAIPTPREHLAAASDGEYLYAVGGRNLSPDRNSGALERYDPAADSWENLAAMPTPRGGLGAVIIGERMVAFGGETSSETLGTVEVYDIAANEWSRGPAMKTPRHGVAGVAFGGTAYALEGARRPGHTNSSAVVESLSLTDKAG
jgi:non-specific serine/threonine protein kinase